MSRRRQVDPELVGLLDIYPTVDLSMDNLAEVRARTLPLPVDPAAVAATSMRWDVAPGQDGQPDVPVVIYRPLDAVDRRLPCIVHLHGGGFVAGRAAGLEPLHRPLALKLDCCIVSVDYRLAPETAFPGNVEDCFTALAWVSEQAEALGVDADRIGLMGESAGGGLAAALALLWRDRGGRPLAFQHLIYPMLDDRTCTHPDPHPHTGDFIWTPHNNRFGWSALLGAEPGDPDVSPYAAPARATDLTGLPPTFISTGGLDLFLEEDLEYARRLMRAGVSVELHVYPGAYHAFDIVPDAEVSMKARGNSLAALTRFLRPRQ